MAREKEKKAPARAEIDITPSWPTPTDPFMPWPWTKPDPRAIPYGKPGKRIRVLVLPGRVEYDPAMMKIELAVLNYAAKGRDVTIVVPDVWRGTGEIMARRTGSNLMVICTDKAGATSLPSNYTFETFASSKIARRRVLREADVVYMIDTHIALDKIKADIADHHDGMKVKTFKSLYVKRPSTTRAQNEAVKEAVRKKIKDSDKKSSKKRKKK